MNVWPWFGVQVMDVGWIGQCLASDGANIILYHSWRITCSLQGWDRRTRFLTLADLFGGLYLQNDRPIIVLHQALGVASGSPQVIQNLCHRFLSPRSHHLYGDNCHVLSFVTFVSSLTTSPTCEAGCSVDWLWDLVSLYPFVLQMPICPGTQQ